MPRLLPLLVSQRFHASVENPRLRLRDALRLDIFERMHSASLRTWSRARAAKLDEIEDVHRAVGSARGGRAAAEQLTHAYALLLSSQFQGFCRDLHSECVAHFVGAGSTAPAAPVIQAALVLARRLDRGTPNPGNIGADFNRLGIELWPEIHLLDQRNAARQMRIAQLVEWRNAIAHDDFGREALVPLRVQLATVRGWRRACDALAGSFDRVMRRYLASIIGTSPW